MLFEERTARPVPERARETTNFDYSSALLVSIRAAPYSTNEFSKMSRTFSIFPRNSSM
jgi:hypothetical protein